MKVAELPHIDERGFLDAFCFEPQVESLESEKFTRKSVFVFLTN